MIEIEVYGNDINVEKGQAGKVVNKDGIAPTVTENHGVVTAIIEKYERTEDNNTKQL